VKYHFEYKKIWAKKDSFEGYFHQATLAAINRVDIRHLKYLDSFLAPDVYEDSVQLYFQYPKSAPVLKEIRKIILFFYEYQSFCVYEYGSLIKVGPTNMGKKSSQTPTGLFFCNWKSKETRSTVDREWILKWNFNLSNFGGVGFHQYDLPGYPVSHSCLRLLPEDAEFLYYWADQWKLSPDGDLLAKGTPVIIFGAYPFGEPRPWFCLVNNPNCLLVNELMLEEIVSPFKSRILEEQSKRMSLFPENVDNSLK
jgi:hypothetical protein